MANAPTFLRAFYSPALYAQLRHERRGWGVGYSVALYAVVALLAMAYALVRDPSPLKESPLALLLVLGIGLLMRATLLAVLTLAARIVAALLRTPLTNAAAARVTAVAYTPVALFDALAFLVFGTMLYPPLLFGGCVVMLLAALYTTK